MNSSTFQHRPTIFTDTNEDFTLKYKCFLSVLILGVIDIILALLNLWIYLYEKKKRKLQQPQTDRLRRRNKKRRERKDSLRYNSLKGGTARGRGAKGGMARGWESKGERRRMSTHIALSMAQTKTPDNRIANIFF